MTSFSQQLLYLLILGGMICYGNAGAQSRDFPFIEPQFERITDAATLNGNTVTALAQDARGLIWIGTQNGLIRYDGYRFRHFSHEATDPFSLAGNYVYALCATKDGRIWVGTTNDGISVFDPTSERFEHFRHKHKSVGSISAGKIFAIAEDTHGGIWVATAHGLNYLAATTKQFVQIKQGKQADSLMDDKVSSLLWDKAGRLWVGSASGLQRLNENGKGFATILTGANVQTLFQAADGKLWLGTSKHGAAWLTPYTENLPAPNWLPPAELSHPTVAGIAQPQADQIWLSTFGGGINVVAAEDGKLLQVLRHDANLPNSLAYDAVVPMLLDRAGWLWIGTWGDAIQRTQPSTLRILRHSQKQARSLSSANVLSILEMQNGQFLFGTSDNGIDIVDRQKGLQGGYRPAKGQVGKLQDAAIFALAQSADGAVWAGTQQHGVVRKTADSELWQPVPGVPDRHVGRLLATQDGSMWAGTASGVARSQPAHSMPKQGTAPPPAHFEVLTDDQGQPMQSFVRAMAQDAQGRIWIGTHNGLWLYEPGHRGLRAINHEPQRADSLASNFILGLLSDSKGQLWVSTDKGLERLQKWDGKQARFDHISAQLGMPGKALGGNLLEDSQGRIWSEEGFIFSSTTQNQPSSLRFEALSKAGGKDIGGSWIGSFAQSRDGLILFGGSQGVAIITPSEVGVYHYAPPLVATALRINGKNSPLAGLALAPLRTKEAMPPFVFTPAQRDFALEFAALDYVEPKKNRYQYRLQGYETVWNNADAEHRSANYGNLPPGEYRLQVRGSNRVGVFSPHELNLPIQVLPAWWQTLSFKAFLVFALGSALYILYRWRVAHLRKQARSLQRLIDARTADILKLSKIGQELTATLNMEQAFDRVYRQLLARLDADAFLIGIVEAQRIAFVYKVENQQRLTNTSINLNELQRPDVHCVCEQAELVFNHRAELENFFDGKPLPISGMPMETVVYLPLLAEKRVIGCLSVQSQRKNAYSKDQLEFMRVLTSYTAIALANSIAHAELSVALSNIKDMQAKLIHAERQKLSIDLHDNLSQTMTGVLLQLDTACEVLTREGAAAATASHQPRTMSKSLPFVERAIELARDGHAQTRDLLQALRSAKSTAITFDLADTLRHDLPRLTLGTDIMLEVCEDGPIRVLRQEVGLALFRIAQESVTNALRHGKAKNIVVLLHWQSAALTTTISDDWKGFDTQLCNKLSGIGLVGMQERINALGGKLHIDSIPGKGTCIRADVPLFPHYSTDKA